MRTAIKIALFEGADPYGDELVTNGTFDTDTGWNKEGSWVINNGYAECPTTGTRSLYQSIGNATIGTSYRITYEILETNGSNFRFSYAGVNGPVQTTTGVKEHIIEAISDGDEFIYFDGLNVFAGKVDNISVKEIL